VAPEIQPCVGFFEFVLRLCQALRDIPWQTEKPIAVSGVDSSVSAGHAGAFNDPVLDGVTELLGSFFDVIADVAQLGQFLQDLNGFLATADTQDALQANDTPDP